MHTFAPAWRWAGVAALAACLAGCAVGPDFNKPAAPNVARYAHVPLAATVATAGVTAGAAQHVDKGAGVSAEWWKQFHSPALDALVQKALAHNPDLAAASAALRAAHEDVLAQRGSFFPSISAGLAASREQDPSAALAPVPSNNAYLYSLFTPELSIRYAPDLFGAHRRQRVALQAQAQAVRFQAVAAWNTLTTNVVVTALRAASLRAQVKATRKLVALERHSLKLEQLRLRNGDASQLDVSTQQAQVAATQAALAGLVKQLDATRNALAVLTGAVPGAAHVPTLRLADLHLPAQLPLSLPSQLVAERPDVRMARANLHAASAAIGIAAAARLPHIELTANVGATALRISKVFTSGTGLWGVAASLTAPIFEAGRLQHQERAAKAAYVEAAQVYRGTVLRAFENVADTLAAIGQDAKALHAAATAAHAAHTALQLARLKLRHGYIGSVQLLQAEQAWQQARMTLIQAQAHRFADTAALYQALGGGWWQRADSDKKAP